MHLTPRAACALALSASLASGVAAQTGPSVLTLNDDYHVASIGKTIPQFAPGTAREILSLFGSFRPRPDGTWTFAGQSKVVRGDGTITNAPDSGAGTYFVRPDGGLVLDYDPMNPGTDTDTFYINADGSVVLYALEDPVETSEMIVAFRESTAATLSGTYRFAGSFISQQGSGTFTASTESGTATFDGTGGFTVTGTEVQFDPFGTGTTSTFGGPGTYAVSADGSVALDGGAVSGAISSNGELFFYVETEPTTGEVGLTVAVRIDPSITIDDIEGDWASNQHELELGIGPTLPATESDLSLATIEAGSPTNPVRGSSRFIRTAPSGSTVFTGTINATITPLGGGLFRVADSGGSDDLAFSESGLYFVGANLTEGTANVEFGMQVCPAFIYGSPSPGSGGFAPRIAMDGFPTLGSSTFAVEAYDLLGGAPTFLLAAADESPGFPVFGITLWVNPATIVNGVPMTLSGPPGVAGDGVARLALPIPVQANLAGVELFVQTLTLDPGASGGGGFAASSGLELLICR